KNVAPTPITITTKINTTTLIVELGLPPPTLTLAPPALELNRGGSNLGKSPSFTVDVDFLPYSAGPKVIGSALDDVLEPAIATLGLAGVLAFGSGFLSGLDAESFTF